MDRLSLSLSEAPANGSGKHLQTERPLAAIKPPRTPARPRSGTHVTGFRLMSPATPIPRLAVTGAGRHGSDSRGTDGGADPAVVALVASRGPCVSGQFGETRPPLKSDSASEGNAITFDTAGRLGRGLRPRYQRAAARAARAERRK